MAFQLSETEIVHHHYPSGVTRILLEQTLDARSNLSHYTGENLYETIQRARGNIARIRAVLLMIKPYIGTAFSAENRRFRELGLELSRLREQHSVLQASEKLKYLSGNINSVLQLESFQERYLIEQSKNPEEKKRRRRKIGEALNKLRCAERTFKLLEPEINETSLAACLDHSLREVMRTYNNALQYGGDDDMYHWRKAINTLLYQTEVLQNFSFAPAQKKRNFLERLSSQLDFYNDLNALHYHLNDWRETRLSYEDFAELSAITESQKRVMSINLLHLGEKFFKMNFSPLKSVDIETYH